MPPPIVLKTQNCVLFSSERALSNHDMCLMVLYVNKVRTDKPAGLTNHCKTLY